MISKNVGLSLFLFSSKISCEYIGNFSYFEQDYVANFIGNLSELELQFMNELVQLNDSLKSADQKYPVFELCSVLLN